MSDPTGDILRAVRHGRLAGPIAILRLVTMSRAPDEIDAAMARPDAPATLAALWRQRRDFWALAKAVLATVNHAETRATPDALAAAFDRAADLSPDAASALYGLGDPALLDRATHEVVDYLERSGALRPEARLLDIGCGAGRFEVALAARTRTILALDASQAMAQAARRRCAAWPHIVVAHCRGGWPPRLPEGEFDLALSVDCFPYIVQSGEDVVAHWFTTAARALAPRGRLVLVNFSYRGDRARDAAEVAVLAEAEGLLIVEIGGAPFRLWDGVIYHLHKP